MELGRIGIWTNLLDSQPATKAQETMAQLEELGFGAVWIPESRGRESFTNSSLLLAGSKRIVVATGITNLYGRDPLAMNAAQWTLAEAFPDRFLLGIGVSHAPTVERLRGHRYTKPLATMQAYLAAMDAAPFMAAPPPAAPPRVLAALGPKMMELSRDRANGAHPYFVPVEHTAQARTILGPDRILAPEVAVVLESEPSRARQIARNHMSYYLELPNYANNLRRLGFGEDDLANGGSDRLVDAIVGWGDLAAVTRRVQEHLAAGADHVCVQVLTADIRPRSPSAEAPGQLPRGIAPLPLPLDQWRQLAQALLP